jgi:glycerophosphoryl diester phosphodiesterase
VSSGRPVRIAHAYGNRLDRLAEALDADIDAIELDAWYRSGEVYVRHERRLGRLPVLADQVSASMPVIGPWALRLPARYFLRPDFRPLRFAEVLLATEGGKSLLIDVKRWDASADDFASKIARLLEAHGSTRSAVVCGSWPVLDSLRQTTAIEIRYTVNTPRRMELYLDRLREGRASPGICAYHPLLDRQTVAMLTERAVDVYAWTVDDPARAGALVELGVSGIISNNLPLLAGLGAAGRRA